MLLKPLTIIKIRYVHDYYWEVFQKFERLNGEIVSVYAHGFTRLHALKRFEEEVWEIAHERPWDFWEDLGNFLMDFFIPFELTIKALKNLIRR